jgi:hypothetical protein
MGQRALRPPATRSKPTNAYVSVLISVVKMFIHGPIRECTGASLRNYDKAHGLAVELMNSAGAKCELYHFVPLGGPSAMMNFDGGDSMLKILPPNT